MQSQIRSSDATASHSDTPMSAHLLTAPGGVVHTEALRRALHGMRDETIAADLLFLESWEVSSIPGVAAALRASQLRRANPVLAAEIRAELNAAKRRPT